MAKFTVTVSIENEDGGATMTEVAVGDCPFDSIHVGEMIASVLESLSRHMIGKPIETIAYAANRIAENCKPIGYLTQERLDDLFDASIEIINGGESEQAPHTNPNAEPSG